MDFCGFETFTKPTDIRSLVALLTGFNVTRHNVPTTGLDSSEVQQEVTELAVAFFGQVFSETETEEETEGAYIRVDDGTIATPLHQEAVKLRPRGRGDTADLYFQNRGFCSQKEGRNETSDYHNAVLFVFKIFDISDFSFRIIARMEDSSSVFQSKIANSKSSS